MDITIKKNNLFLDFKHFFFPGGEIGIKLNANNYKYLLEQADHQTIIARVQNSNDLVTVAMVKNAIEELEIERNVPHVPINLFLPYVPYARQDRVCDKGEAFSLKVFGELINSLNFNRVIVCDPHSEVTRAAINRVKIISQFDIINKYLDFVNRIRTCILVSPDAGSNKKTAEIAKFLDHDNFVRADKLRDLTNGNIKETIVYYDDFKGRDVVICDDICDGGRTFIELAKVLKAKNAGKVILYVTHGIFSKGVKTLFLNGIDEIWTTNAFKWISSNDDPSYDERVKVLNLEEKFNYLL